MPNQYPEFLKPPSGNTCLEHVTVSDGEYVAVLNHGSNERSYLTRDFLEVVKESNSLYYSAAQALAEETLSSFAHTVMSTEEEGFLAHRKLNDEFHAFSFHSAKRMNKGKLDKTYTEYLLTQSEVDGIYDQAHGQIIESLDLGMFESPRAKAAANYNLALLSAKASVNGPL